MVNPEKVVWQETTIKELLNLTDADMQYIELKTQLADALRKERQSQALSQRQLAENLETGQARVARMESADESVSLDAIIRSLLSLGFSSKDIGNVIAS